MATESETFLELSHLKQMFEVRFSQKDNFLQNKIADGRSRVDLRSEKFTAQ